MRRVFALAALPALVAFGAVAAESEPVTPLVNAHAHNDYEHDRPLLDALDHGFCSVEADIHLVDGQLLVAHDREDVKPDRTLEALYLDPLRKRAKANGGRVYPNGPRFILLVDIKGSGIPAYNVLKRVLGQYADILTEFRADTTNEKAVTVIISGSRPTRLVARDAVRYAAVDGRTRDLESDAPVHLIPLISDHFMTAFQLPQGEPLPDDINKRVRQYVKKAHQKNRLVRFWGTPHDPALWADLLDAGVDLINADDLEALQTFLLERQSRE